MPKLEIRSLTKRFGNVTAVDGIDLTVDEGESVVLLGPSGCGKTTTLRVVAGFEQPDGGSVAIEGQEVASSTVMVPPERRQLSMVFQSYAVWPHKTVYENIAFGLRIKRLSRSEIDARVMRALDLVRMRDLKDRYPAQLSGGQQQRVALARALVLEPKILLFDEPLSNLDATLREEMRFEIRKLQQELGFTAIYVTHDQTEAMVIGDRIVVMKDGRIEQVGTPRDVYLHSETKFVATFIGLANIFQGRVAGNGSAGGRLKVDVEFGTQLELARPPFWQGKVPTSPVSLFVRPEDIRITTAVGAAGAPGSFKARVVEKTFLGPVIDLRLEPEKGPSLRALVHHSTPVDSGETVEVSFDPSRCQFLRD